MKHTYLLVAFTALSCANPVPTAVSPDELATDEDELATDESGAPSPPDTTQKQKAKQWEPFVETVDLPPEIGDRTAVDPFVRGFGVVVEGLSRELVGILDLETVEFIDLPSLHGVYEELRPQIYGADTDFATAQIVDDANEVVHFEVFRRETMQWSPAGSFKLPKIVEPTDPDQKVRRNRRVTASHSGDQFQIWLWDGYVAVESHVFDRETAVWSEQPIAFEPNSCIFGCRNMEDTVRWGGDPDPASNDADRAWCAAVRRSPEDDWKRLEVEGGLLSRDCYPLDEDRVLVVGGFDVSGGFFPGISKESDVVSIDDGTVRSIEDPPRVGWEMEIPTESRLLWMRPGGVTTFDQASERFEHTPLGEDIAPRWGVRIDERTVLASKQDGTILRFGFRPVK